ncbi:MAG: aspartate kinase [Myxococcota bacterium]|nr:aspartate kinase [Myxococcota bacterium]
MIVMKFGGTSVKDAAAVDRVAGIISERVHLNPVVVVSATGKTTDELVDILDRLEESRDVQALADHIETNHHKLVTELISNTEHRTTAEKWVGRERERLGKLIEGMKCLGEVSLRSRDAVLSVGERVSAPILASCLASRGLNAVCVDPSELIVTDNTHGAATPLTTRTAARCKAVLGPLLDKGAIPVVGGYVGATDQGVITTLGRGGSDLTASLIASVMGAENLEFWKDVDGILTADPRVVEAARPVDAVSFREAAELAFLGAGVLHPASIQPAVEAGVPVVIKNSYSPETQGTRIVLRTKMAPREVVTSIAYKRDQVMLNVYSTRMLGASGFLRRVFEVFDRLAISVDHIATSEVNVTVTLKDSEKLHDLEDMLGEVANVEVTRNMGVVSVVGEFISATSGVAGTILAALSHINLSLITYGGSGVNLSVVVNNDQVPWAVKALHRALFEGGEPQ